MKFSTLGHESREKSLSRGSSMKRNIALFANGDAGIEVAKFLNSKGENVSHLFLSEIYPEKDYLIREILKGNPEMQIYLGDLRNDLEMLNAAKKMANIDALLTVYWPFLIPAEVFEICPITINFHPALLPINRGWYPHVHSILDGTPAGVTLHQLAAGADQGDIWAQEEIEIFPWENAGDVYAKLQRQIVKLFINNWEKIMNNEIVPLKQNEKDAIYHSKNEIKSLDEIDFFGSYVAKDLINLLRARTFGEHGFAYFTVDGQKIRARIELKPDSGHL